VGDGEAIPAFTMVRIPSHPQFAMGSVTDGKDPGEAVEGSAAAEAGQVIASEAEHLPVSEFWMSDRGVSEHLFRAVLGEKASEIFRLQKWELTMPVLKVNFYDAIIFCNRLSHRLNLKPYYRFAEEDYDFGKGDLREGGRFPEIAEDGRGGYRLPTEREWEYACRALSRTRYGFGDLDHRLDLFGQLPGSSVTSPMGREYLGSFWGSGRARPSRWGSFDLHGNETEWCWDQYAEGDSGRVLRGGSFYNDAPDVLRSATRGDGSPEIRNFFTGFRLSRTR
jgi:formylglycine-generating enzyme required for sulfatase activity